MLSFRRLLRGKTTFGMRLPPPPQTGFFLFCIILILHNACLHSRRLTIQMFCFPRTGFLIESICLTAFYPASDGRSHSSLYHPFFRYGCLHSRRLTIQMVCFPRREHSNGKLPKGIAVLYVNCDISKSTCVWIPYPTSDRRRVSCPVVEFLLYIIIVGNDSWLLLFYLAISRGGIPPRLVLSGGCTASLMYFVWLPSCGVVPQEEGLFFCKTYRLVNVSLNPISWLSCVLRRRDLLRRS